MPEEDTEQMISCFALACRLFTSGRHIGLQVSQDSRYRLEVPAPTIDWYRRCLFYR